MTEASPGGLRPQSSRAGPHLGGGPDIWTGSDPAGPTPAGVFGHRHRPRGSSSPPPRSPPDPSRAPSQSPCQSHGHVSREASRESWVGATAQGSVRPGWGRMNATFAVALTTVNAHPCGGQGSVSSSSQTRASPVTPLSLPAPSGLPQRSPTHNRCDTGHIAAIANRVGQRTAGHHHNRRWGHRSVGRETPGGHGNLGWRFGVIGVRSGGAGHRVRRPADNSIGGDRFRLRWLIQVKRAEGCGCDLVNHATANL